jgi:ubiquinone/menaquinone biosynthesis C-methylase UbiE
MLSFSVIGGSCASWISSRYTHLVNLFSPQVRQGRKTEHCKWKKKKPTGAGKSSFDLIDTERFFQLLDLLKGISFLDVASGRGAYSLAVSDIIGPQGSVVAVDLWAGGIEMLKAAAQERKFENDTALVRDVGR